jgi:hypothetical protein
MTPHNLSLRFPLRLMFKKILRQIIDEALTEELPHRTTCAMTARRRRPIQMEEPWDERQVIFSQVFLSMNLLEVASGTA